MEYGTIEAKELKEKISSGDDFVLVDVLGEDSYNARHLPGAINIPVNADDFDKKIKKAVPDTTKEVILYCASETCQASSAAARKLVQLGYSNVKDFESGLAGWQEAGFEFES